MCAPTHDGYAEYGTILYIQEFKQLVDGRSSIQTIGDKRFKVLEKSTRDGFTFYAR